MSRDLVRACAIGRAATLRRGPGPAGVRADGLFSSAGWDTPTWAQATCGGRVPTCRANACGGRPAATSVSRPASAHGLRKSGLGAGRAADPTSQAGGARPHRPTPHLRSRRATGMATSSPDAAQALKIIRRRRDRHGRWSVQTVYAITSLDARQAEPALLATWVRGHWSIEACLHWVRDVTFREDHSQVRTDHGPTNLAALRTLAINALRLTGHTNIAAGLRKHARTPLMPLVTLGLS